MQSGRVLAANHNGAYVIRFVGDVRLTLCTSIDDYFQHMFEDPEFTSVWIDLCGAEGIDSTTLGLLAKLALKVKDVFGFEPAIYSCEPGINRLLRSMGFERLFQLHEQVCENPEDIIDIPAVKGSEDSVREKVIEAHRVLMDISDENRGRFKELVNALERS